MAPSGSVYPKFRDMRLYQSSHENFISRKGIHAAAVSLSSSKFVSKSQ